MFLSFSSRLFLFLFLFCNCCLAQKSLEELDTGQKLHFRLYYLQTICFDHPGCYELQVRKEAKGLSYRKKMRLEPNTVEGWSKWKPLDRKAYKNLVALEQSKEPRHKLEKRAYLADFHRLELHISDEEGGEKLLVELPASTLLYLPDFFEWPESD